MKYALQFGLMSIAALLWAAFGVTALSARFILVWVAVSFAVVVAAYACSQPRLLMKRADGSQPILPWLILWPYFLLVHFSLFLYRVSSRRKIAVAEVSPGVWFARRRTAREIRDSEVTWSAVLDLAAEFPRVAAGGVAYRSIPILDGAVPSAAQLSEAVTWIDEQRESGNALVHCALGHGRTGSVILAWLLSRKLAPDLESGVAHLVARRSTFGISKAQATFVEKWTTDRFGKQSLHAKVFPKTHPPKTSP